MSKTILITGGLGFIGSNFIEVFLDTYPSYKIVNIDKITYAANKKVSPIFQKKKMYHFIQGDICDKELIEKLFKQYEFDGIIHFAAESHVDNSINDPENFIKTNIFGTYVLLESARKHWKKVENKALIPSQNRFHHISTDEVYGSLGKTGYFTEDTAYSPNSPYSASKASSDHLVKSYCNTFGLNGVITNCSNNYGPFQNSEKFIPTVITKAINNQPIPIYGNGKNIRDWIYVKDHCKAISMVFFEGKKGETYNIGGDCEWENVQIAEKICLHLDEVMPKGNGKSYVDQICFVKDRPGHDHRYAIDSSKIKNDLNWSVEHDFNASLHETISWFLQQNDA